MLNGSSVTILVLIFVYFVSGSEEGCCPSSKWIETSSGWYYFEVSTYRNWDESKVFCEQLGGHLLKVTTENIGDITFHLTSYTGVNQVDSVWVGGKYYRDDDEFRWTDGSRVDIYFWVSDWPHTLSYVYKQGWLMLLFIDYYIVASSLDMHDKRACICEFNPIA